MTDDFAKLMNAMSTCWAESRSEYHLTLGEAIDQIKTFDPILEVEFDFGGYPDGLDSYRGYYSDLAIDKRVEKTTVDGFTAMLEAALDNTYTGYKGGDYTMTETTPLWFGAYGRSSGLAVMGLSLVDGCVRIDTKQLD